MKWSSYDEDPGYIKTKKDVETSARQREFYFSEQTFSHAPMQVIAVDEGKSGGVRLVGAYIIGQWAVHRTPHDYADWDGTWLVTDLVTGTCLPSYFKDGLSAVKLAVRLNRVLTENGYSLDNDNPTRRFYDLRMHNYIEATKAICLEWFSQNPDLTQNIVKKKD